MNETTQNATKQEDDSIRIQELFHLCINKWLWFVISLVICLSLSFYYLLTTPPTYTRTASILIKDDSEGSSISSDIADFGDFGMFSKNTSVNNEIQTLKSPDLMREVISRLNLDQNYFIPGEFYKQILYGDSLPVIAIINNASEREPLSFTLNLQENGKINLSDFRRKGKNIDIEIDSDIAGYLNDTITTPIGDVVIKPTATYKNNNLEIFVEHRPLQNIIENYISRLKVTQNDDKSDIIDISFADISIQRADDVLHTLITVYNENWITDKNQIAQSTSLFINERLGVIEDELGNVDEDISSYKSKHLLPDVQSAADMYINQASEATAMLMTLNNQVYMANYIRNYLINGSNKNSLIPANYGIDNENIANQILAYNNKMLERNSLVTNSSSTNPLVVDIDKSLSFMRDALISSIDNQLVALNAQIKSQQGNKGNLTSKLASNPQQAKYLLNVERQQMVKQSLYLYLLQKREENELSQAFTAYNTRIITQPGGSNKPTSPIKINILLIAFIIGIAVPIIIIIIKENLNTRIRGRRDIENSSIPFIGEIPLSERKEKRFSLKKVIDNKQIVVQEGNRNVINEAFRVLRTNLEFMTENGNNSNVIIITSFNPGSGKSFLTMNTALSLAIKNKKVLVIDGDLRHGSASAYIDSPKPGLSEYLNGRINDLKEIIVSNKIHQNLDVIPIGTNPPNPTELLFNERMKQVIESVRSLYDYIFVDCPPIDIVADTQILEKLADRTIFVIRAGLLERSMLTELESLYINKKYKNMALILNGTDSNGGQHRYRYGYYYGHNSY